MIGAFGRAPVENPLSYVWDQEDTWPFYNTALPHPATETEFFPFFDMVAGERFSTRVVSLNLRHKFDTFIADRTAGTVEVVHIHYGTPDWETTLQNSSTQKLRILHNVILDIDDTVNGTLDFGDTPDENECIATLFFPPGWIYLQTLDLPILFCGRYDTNIGIFGKSSNYQDRDLETPGVQYTYTYQPGMFIAEQIALSNAFDLNQQHDGAIGVFWNGGGDRSSSTMTELAYKQFSDIIDTVSTRFGGDRHRIVIFGGSRGGTTALEMACKPSLFLGSAEERDFTILAASASSFAARPGTIADLKSMTYPGILGRACWFVGWRNAWKHGWTYPTDRGYSELRGGTGEWAMARIATGAVDQADADARFALVSDEFIDRGLDLLRPDLPLLYLSIGSHDFTVPYLSELEFLERVKKDVGMTPRVDHAIRGGHGPILQDYDFGPSPDVQRLPSAFFQAHKALYGVVVNDSAQFDGTGEEYWAYDYGSRMMARMTDQPDHRPFTMEAPYRAFHQYTDNTENPPLILPDEPFPIEFVGERGTQYLLEITDMDGNVDHAVSGTIPAYASDKAPGVVEWVTPSAGWGTPKLDGSTPYRACKYELSILLPGATAWKFLVNQPHNTPPRDEHLMIYAAYHHENGGVADKSGKRLADYASAYSGTESANQVNWGLAEF